MYSYWNMHIVTLVYQHIESKTSHQVWSLPISRHQSETKGNDPIIKWLQSALAAQYLLKDKRSSLTLPLSMQRAYGSGHLQPSMRFSFLIVAGLWAVDRFRSETYIQFTWICTVLGGYRYYAVFSAYSSYLRCSIIHFNKIRNRLVRLHTACAG